MQVIDFEKFNVVGSAQIPAGDYAYVSIGPDSDVDTCLVGGRRLGVLSVVPYKQNLEAIRGYRFMPHDLDEDGRVVDPEQVNSKLQLQLWRAGECPVVGPRAPAVVESLTLNDAIGTTAATAARLLRLPFSGRRQATFFVRPTVAEQDGTPGAITLLNLVVRGVRYLGRDSNGVRKTNGEKRNEVYDEAVDTWTPVASIVDADSDGADVGRTIHVGGGGDMQESYDELELWAYRTGDGDVIAVGEAFGERVL